MDESIKKVWLKQLDNVQAELNRLFNMMSDEDYEKRQISMLIVGFPDLHIKDPEAYERLAPYADENKPPFTPNEIMRINFGMGDTRLTYAQREEWKQKYGDR